MSSPGIALADSGAEHILIYAAGAPGTTRTVVAGGAVVDIGYVVQGPSGPTTASTTWVFPDGSLSVSLSFTGTVFENLEACRLAVRSACRTDSS